MDASSHASSSWPSHASQANGHRDEPRGPSFNTLRPRQRKRSRKVSAKHANHVQAPLASASSSSWGAVGVEEEHPAGSDDDGDSETSSSSTSDKEGRPSRDLYGGHDTRAREVSSHGWNDGTAAPSAARAPPRKRRHLGTDDVGRFANMSIEPRTTPSPHQRLKEKHIQPNSVIEPSPEPSSRFERSDSVSSGLAPAASQTSRVFAATHEIKPSAIEEPEHRDDDSAADHEMRSRKGSQTLELDSNRFYVTSLSDSSSDEDEVTVREERETKRVQEALQAADSEELAGLLASGDDRTQYVINGELVSRMQAKAWQERLALGLDKAAAPLFSALAIGDAEQQQRNLDEKRSALVLWRKPEHMSLNFGKAAETAGDGAGPAPQSPPIVLDDGEYAYVRRSVPHPDRRNNLATATQQDAAATLATPPDQAQGVDAMEVDD